MLCLIAISLLKESFKLKTRFSTTLIYIKFIIALKLLAIL
jgi:hypothetical protein